MHPGLLINCGCDECKGLRSKVTCNPNIRVKEKVLYGCWIVINLGWIPGVPKFDPTFVILAMVASVEAIFISTFVLVSQNRMGALADQRADLDLQISLLSEHEITRLLTLVSEIARRMNVPQANDPELQDLATDVGPEQVLDHMRETEKKLDQG